MGVRGHKHRTSPVSVGLLVSVNLLLFVSSSACVFPPRSLSDGLLARPRSDTPARNVPPFQRSLVLTIFNCIHQVLHIRADTEFNFYEFAENSLSL